MAKVSLAIGTPLGNHQAQAQALDAALLAAGLVAVPTEGELDLVNGDFTVPPSSATTGKTYGFKIYRTPDDGLGDPLYLRFYYLTRYRRRFSTTTYYHEFNVTINVATDAGFSNQISSSFVSNEGTLSTSWSAGTGKTYICVKPGYVGIAIKVDMDIHNNQDWIAGGFAIASRTKDRDGNFTSDGWLALDPPSMGDTAVSFGMRRSIGGMPATYHSDGCLYLTLNNLAPMSEGAVQLQFPMTVSQHMHPFEELGIYYNPSSMSVGDVVQAEVGGIPREYVVMGQAGMACLSVGSTAINKTVGFVMLWED